jgi:hypothetical protein
MLTLEMIDRAAASMERAEKYEPYHLFVHPDCPREYVDAVRAAYPHAFVHVTDGLKPQSQ